MIHSLGKLYNAKLVDRTHCASDRAQPERRSGGRSLSLYWAAMVSAIGWTGPAMVVQISAGGMRVRSALNPTMGTQALIELPGVAPLRGNVRWTEGDQFGVQLDMEINVADVLRSHRRATGTRQSIDERV